MSKPKTGGTLTWCPYCKEETSCEAISLESAEQYVTTRLAWLEYYEIHSRNRGRRCLQCSQTFVTAEANYMFLEELVSLKRKYETLKSKSDRLENSIKSAVKLFNESINLESKIE